MFDRMNIGSTGRSMLMMVMMTLVLTTAATGMAAAQDGGDGTLADGVDAQNFICDNTDSVFVSFLQGIIGLFFIASWGFAIVSFGLDKLDKTTGDIDILPKDWGGSGDDAILAAFLLPVGIWFLVFIGNAFFGYNLTCLMPLQ